MHSGSMQLRPPYHALIPGSMHQSFPRVMPCLWRRYTFNVDAGRSGGLNDTALLPGAVGGKVRATYALLNEWRSKASGALLCG